MRGQSRPFFEHKHSNQNRLWSLNKRLINGRILQVRAAVSSLLFINSKSYNKSSRVGKCYNNVLIEFTIILNEKNLLLWSIGIRCFIYQYEEIVSYMIQTLHTSQLRQVLPFFYFIMKVILFP